ncbi:MAG: FAD-binding oxidoreductase [Actinobacteria bacterium]|nr:MAG: FAD-binding oxidoreductase [Actinomycetota bacterium]
MTDFVVIGGGIAGVSAAANLAPHGSVALLESERSLAFHTTGRSAALFIVNYGGPGSRPLAHASRGFLENPPEYAADSPLLTGRGALWVARPEDIGELARLAREGAESGADSDELSPEEVMRLVPIMRPEHLGGGLYEETARDIDVAGLHQAFVRVLRRHGGEIHLDAPVKAIERKGSGWLIETPNQSLHADAIVNAAGAWGDEVASLAGVVPIGLQPMRRTAFMVPGSSDFESFPMVVSVGHDYYFRPDGVQLLCSLSEEEPCHPCDPKPRMEDVALAIERINEATTLDIRSVNSQWTGLRTFAPDRDLVIGEDPTAPGFFWLVGQGGTGIMTSPGYGKLVASQVIGEDLPEDLRSAGVNPDITSPARFRS